MEAAGGCPPSELKLLHCDDVQNAALYLGQGPSGQARPMRPEGKGLFEMTQKNTHSLEVVSPTNTSAWKRHKNVNTSACELQVLFLLEETSYSFCDVTVFSLWHRRWCQSSIS